VLQLRAASSGRTSWTDGKLQGSSQKEIVRSLLPFSSAQHIFHKPASASPPTLYLRFTNPFTFSRSPIKILLLRPCYSSTTTQTSLLSSQKHKHTTTPLLSSSIVNQASLTTTPSFQPRTTPLPQLPISSTASFPSSHKLCMLEDP